MAYQTYKSEDELVEQLQDGQIGWMDFVTHHSPEWQEEYSQYCKDHDLVVGEASAEQFVEYKGELMEESLSK